jgi:hypothetical protein
VITNVLEEYITTSFTLNFYPEVGDDVFLSNKTT